MSLDLDQMISFTPTGLAGQVCYQEQGTATSACESINVPTSGSVDLNLSLGLGTWDIWFSGLVLQNTFTNTINLEIRPNFNYIVGTWPAPGQGFGFPILNDDFALGFNRITTSAFTVNVVQNLTPTAVPEPASLLLLGTGLVAGAGRLRRRRQRTS